MDDLTAERFWPLTPPPLREPWRLDTPAQKAARRRVLVDALKPRRPGREEVA